MTLTRRKTLALIGGGVVLAATATTMTLTKAPETALAPWAAAGQYDDPRMRALSWAILAPNPHNRQPWMADLATPDEITLYVDTNRLLPHTDPFSRQVTIGLGCFLETLRMAAAEEGRGTQITLFPEGEDPQALDQRPVARIRFAGSADPDPLFAHVLARRSNKEPYDITRAVPDQALTQLNSSVRHTRIASSNAPDHVADMRQLSRDALLVEIETPHTYKESVDLFRIGRREVDANPDGIDFTGPLFEALHRTGLMTREAALDTSSTMYREGVKAVLANTDTAMAHIWIATQGNSRSDQIRAGYDWMRLNLATTALGLSIQPLSQALQEYPEMAAYYAEIHERLAQPGETVQMFARLGYGPEVPPSPRWGVGAKTL